MALEASTWRQLTMSNLAYNTGKSQWKKAEHSTLWNVKMYAGEVSLKSKLLLYKSENDHRILTIILKSVCKKKFQKFLKSLFSDSVNQALLPEPHKCELWPHPGAFVSVWPINHHLITCPSNKCISQEASRKTAFNKRMSSLAPCVENGFCVQTAQWGATGATGATVVFAKWEYCWVYGST